jgi:asparagine synthase (glutamine-hydrolysing)
MCGFIGLISNKLISQEARLSLRNSLDTMSHRGPDGIGEYHSEYCYLGHARLQILDLNPRSNQPFINPKNGDVLVYNGEIYNYKSLKNELKSVGFVFLTESDTEVLLYSFDYWGVHDTLTKLEGMFSGAFFHKKTNTTYLFRDPYGQKPLYWSFDKNHLIFSSELRGILNSNLKKWRFSAENFARYLFNGYYGFTDTPLEEVFKLQSGFYLQINGEVLTSTQYFNHNNFSTNSNRKLSDSVDELDYLLEESVTQTLQSDVPVGIFLSGGIDSSLIMHYCTRHQKDVRALCVSMSEQDYDEASKAKNVADHLKINDLSIFSLDEKKITELVKIVMDKMDEPHGDPGLINAFFLSENSKNFIKVAITGDGGDEFFTGYESFKAINYSRLFNRFKALNLASNFLLSKLSDGDGYLSLKFKMKSFMRGSTLSQEHKMAAWLSTISSDDLQKLVSQNYGHVLPSIKYPNHLPLFFQFWHDNLNRLSDLQISQLFYQKIFLPEFICMHSDRATMLNGIESRAPFLSTKVTRFANTLPDNQKIGYTTSKIILRELAKRLNLPQLIYKQKKQGFTFPIARWLKSTMKPLIDEMIADDDFFLLVGLNVQYARELAHEHHSGKSNNYRILYCLIVARKWAHNYSSKIQW